MDATVCAGVRRVLILEDNFPAAQSLRLLLESAGYVVAGPTPTVEGAKTLLRDEAIDVAVLDYRLREVDSEPIARLCLKTGVPVVFLTGYGSAMQRSADLAHLPTLQKPADPQQVLKTLKSLLM